MEESQSQSQEILLSSLQNYGVLIPPIVSSIKDLTPPTLVSLCSQCLLLLDPTASFPTSLPDTDDDDVVADRFKICADFASAFRDLGFDPDISFHKFLYPSEEDLYKLVGFLVEKLSESSRCGDSIDVKDTFVDNSTRLREDELNCSAEGWKEKDINEGVGSGDQAVEASLRDLNLNTHDPESSNAKDENLDSIGSQEINIVAFTDPLRPGTGNVEKEEDVQDSRDSVAASRDDKHGLASEGNDASCKEQPSKDIHLIERLRNQEKLLKEELPTNTIEIKQLEEEFEVLNAAAEFASDDQHPPDFYVEQFSQRVDAKRQGLVELESEWDAIRRPLEERKKSLQVSLYATNPEAQEKLQKIREVDLETESVLSEIERRKEEHTKLAAELEKQPKVASRRSHIQRIMEITKNSRKQDADIERILKETRELQLESNSIQERLRRTYAILDEIVFREAKKDAVGRQAYRLLTSIHETFEQISEKILATDRVRREVADYEAKLASMASRSLNVDKLQADLDAIRKENETLEQSLKTS